MWYVWKILGKINLTAFISTENDSQMGQHSDWRKVGEPLWWFGSETKTYLIGWSEKTLVRSLLAFLIGKVSTFIFVFILGSVCLHRNLKHWDWPQNNGLPIKKMVLAYRTQFSSFLKFYLTHKSTRFKPVNHSTNIQIIIVHLEMNLHHHHIPSAYHNTCSY
jgi:hypothetical protein